MLTMKTRDVGGLNPYILINSSFREMVAGRCGKTCKHVFSLPIGYYMSFSKILSINQWEKDMALKNNQPEFPPIMMLLTGK